MTGNTLPATSTPQLRSLAASLGLAVILAMLADRATAQQDSIEVPITDSNGKNIGSAQLTEQKSGVRIRVQASGLTPGEHGLHIHSTGKCQAPDFKSAGPHYSPQNRGHGFLDSNGPHAGDLPVLNAAADGAVNSYDFTSTRVALNRDSLLDSDGSSLIIHAKADDYLTDTGGGSGERIACGVISLAADANPPSQR